MFNLLLLFAFMPCIIPFTLHGVEAAGMYPIYTLVLLWIAIEAFPRMARSASDISVNLIWDEYIEAVDRLDGKSLIPTMNGLQEIKYSADLFMHSR